LAPPLWAPTRKPGEPCEKKVTWFVAPVITITETETGMTEKVFGKVVDEGVFTDEAVLSACCA